MVIVAILLDRNQENIFYVGQIVSGNVRVETNEEIKMRGVRLELHGEARVHWSEGSGKSRTSYSGHENLIGFKVYLAGSDNSNSEMMLQPGIHTFPLSFVLPNTVPSSFEGLHGSIRYKVQAVIDRPWKIDDSAEILITVVRWLNLNYEAPQLREPIAVQDDNPTVGCCYHCCCIKGLPVIELRINRGCFVPGETITVNGQLVNNSNTNISNTTISFMMEVQFCATYGTQVYRTKQQYQTLGCFKRPPVECGRTDTWTDVAFTVPPVVASRLDGCNIININYFITVKADFDKGCAESAIRQGIIIGHVPLQGNPQFGGPIMTQPSMYTSPPPPLQPGPGPQFCRHKEEPRNSKFGRFELDADSASINGPTPWKKLRNSYLNSITGNQRV